MGDKVAYSIFDTVFGLCGIAGTDKGVIRLILPGMTEDEIILRLCTEKVSALSPVIASRRRSNLKRSGLLCRSAPRNDISMDIEDSIKRYFNGERIDFDFPVDLSHCTEFQRRVYKITKTIYYCEVRTYKWIAERLRMPDAARAVGNALSRNPVPLIIPCHRIIRGNGKIGGFTAPGGIGFKMRMLKMEAGIED